LEEEYLLCLNGQKALCGEHLHFLLGLKTRL
jgi:hypothetical protein